MAKITITQIQKEAEKEGWQLLSTEYKNLKTELNFICPEKHKIILTYEKWRRNHLCPVCLQQQKDLSKITTEVLPKKTNGYRILSLDQATNITGWAIFENGELLKHGIYISDGSASTEKIESIKIWLLNIIKLWQIDFVQLEDIQLQDHSNEDAKFNEIGVTTYKILAQLQGVLENILFINKIEYSICSPNTWRKFNEIKGRYKADKKKNAQLKVKMWYNIDVSLDEAEAICIGRYAAANHTKKTSLIEWE